MLAKAEDDTDQEIELDFNLLQNYVLEFNVDIGESAYWSEIASVQTLDNLQKSNLIDPVTYIESIPDSQLPNKAKILADMQEKAEQQQMMIGGAPDAMPELPLGNVGGFDGNVG